MNTSPKLFESFSQELSPEKRARNIFILSIGIAILLFVLLVTTIVINQSVTSGLIPIITLACGIVIFGISAWLSRHHLFDLAAGINLTSLSIMILSRVFFQKGIALQVGIIYFILISAIAIYTLQRKWIGTVSLFAFLVTAFTVILDQFTVGVPQSTSVVFTTWLTILVSVVYLAALASQFHNLSLRVKLIIGFLLLSIIPLFILGWQMYATTSSIVENQIKADLLRSSLYTKSNFQEFIEGQFTTLQADSRRAEILNYLSLPDSTRNGSDAEQQLYRMLSETAKGRPSYIDSYIILDNDGKVLVDSSHAAVGKTFANEDFFIYISKNKKPFVSGLRASADGAKKYIYFSTPIVSNIGDSLGFYVVKYDASILNSTFLQIAKNNQPPQTEYTFLIDSTNYVILAHTTRTDLLFKTYLGPGDEGINALLGQGVLTQNTLGQFILPQPQLVNGLSRMSDSAFFQAPSQEYNNEPAEVAAVRVQSTNWIIATARPLSSVALITQNQTRSNVIVSVLITLLAALIAVIASNLFTNPIIQLTHVAENISNGNFSQKADVLQNDEIGILARTFNSMTDQIQGLISNLENRVEQRTSDLVEKTTDLELATIQLEKRARQLERITEISRIISTEKDQEKLLTLITQNVSESFGYYHVGIFLLDGQRKYALLRAANSPGGQLMLRKEHKLEVGQTGIVGNVTASGNPRVALDTGTDSVFFNNPDLPETRSEMAVPLIARGEIIGALDVQSTIQNGFSNEDVSILSLLADQVAIAIDNVRLLENAQSALVESQTLFTEYIANAWQKKSGSAVMGFRQTVSGGKVISANSPEGLDQQSGDKGNNLEIPIRVREQVIGILNIRPNNDGKTWKNEEINIVEAVAERLGLALDNARLFEETSTRASRERLVTDITTKIRGTNDPQEMIRTAIEELQRALGASRIEIVPQKISPPDS